MNNLYNSLADVYESMYQTFIDYEEEFNLYKQLLLKFNCHSVAIACYTLPMPFPGNPLPN